MPKIKYIAKELSEPVWENCSTPECEVKVLKYQIHDLESSTDRKICLTCLVGLMQKGSVSFIQKVQ